MRTRLRATERRGYASFPMGYLRLGDGRTFWLQPDAATHRRGPRGRRMRQLGLTFEFQPNNELRALGSDKWCDSLSALPEFRQYVYRPPHLRPVPRIKSGGPSLIIKSET